MADGVDSSGVLPDGTRIDGPAGLRQVLLDRKDQFVTTATERLLTYALGGALNHFDMPAVRKIVRDAAPTDYPLVLIDHGHRQQCAVSNEESTLTMMVFKKSIPRRTFLRGAGAALALPLLDAMFPAFASARQTAPLRATRLSFLAVPNGIIMDRWTPAAIGKGYPITPVLEPLAHSKIGWWC